MKHHTINIEEVNIHYVKAGRDYMRHSSRQTIVFLHGFPDYWGAWHAQFDHLSDKYRVIAPD
jgi:pimeloyl-ACP methyl ester carboxylesterase